MQVLHDFGALNTPPEALFDDLTALAADACSTPISLISLLDANRQWFKSRRGLSLSETPLTLSFCVHTVRDPGPVFIVPDTRADPRFSDNALVRGEPHVRFYAGSALRTREGVAIGTLCVADFQPRRLETPQRDALERLARQAMTHLETRRGLRKLQGAAERFEAVAGAASDAIWDWNVPRAHQPNVASSAPDHDTRPVNGAPAEGRELSWSAGLTAILGFTASDVPADMAAWTELIHPDDRQRVADHRYAALASEAAVWREEYRVRRKDGRYAFVGDCATILRDQQGHACRMCGGLRNLTELRHLQDEASRALRLERLGSLAAGIAHDLNNAVTPVLLAADMLKSQPPAAAPDPLLLETITGGIKRAADLVKQFVSFARPPKCPRDLTQLRPVLLDLVARAPEVFSQATRITSSIAADLWPVCGNAAELNQVFMNLLLNARDAMPTGGMLSLTAKNAQLPNDTCSPFRRKAGAYIVVEVSDTGTGMSDTVQDRCFEPFFTTKPPGAGSGLGLSLVHGIVTSHQGFVRVASELGEGSTFHVFLPAEPKDLRLSAEIAPPASGSKRGHGRRILLVDDEELIRLIASLALKNEGYDVVTATNGREALGLFSDRPDDFDLAIMDLMMPVMDGATCIAELIKIRPKLRIIIATGGVRPSFQGRLPEGIPFLNKPFFVASLLSIVAKTIDGPLQR